MPLYNASSSSIRIPERSFLKRNDLSVNPEILKS
jgi:hypothetical protein